MTHVFPFVIIDSLNKNKCNKVAGLFLDLAKSFDTVDHNILFLKPHHAGVRGVPLDWFYSHLRGRIQYV